MNARLALLILALLPLSLAAQKEPSPTDPPAAARPLPFEPPAGTTDCGKLPTRTQVSDCTQKYYQTKIVYLTNISAQNDANEILVAVRNMFDPSLKVYLVVSQNAIVIGTYPEAITKIEALIHSLDRPRKTYRLTFTIAESDAGKRVGVEHFAIIAVDGQQTTLKQGDKIPVATGSYGTGGTPTQTQFTYLDVGMNFDITASTYTTGILLKSKVEQSAVGPSTTIAGVQEPVVRQTVLSGISAVPLGKALMLGSIDIPNSTRHLDIDVLPEEIK